jgi:uncharacterized protein YraI
MKRACRWILFAVAMAMPLWAAAQQAFTLRDVEVFAGPSSEYPPVATLPPNAGVRVAGCLSDWSWCDIIFSGFRGWVYAADLGYPYENQRVVIIEYGPRLSLPVVTFSLNTYWERHYRERPWYREREQWVTRVQVQPDRGGRPPAGRAAQAPRSPDAGQQPQQGGRAAEKQQPPRREQAQPQQREPSPRAGRPPERSTESGRLPDAGPPAAGGKRPEAARPEGAPPAENEGARGRGPARPHQGDQQRQAAPPAAKPSESKRIPDAGPPGAGGKPPEAGRAESAHPKEKKDEGARGGRRGPPDQEKGGGRPD